MRSLAISTQTLGCLKEASNVPWQKEASDCILNVLFLKYLLLFLCMVWSEWTSSSCWLLAKRLACSLIMIFAAEIGFLLIWASWGSNPFSSPLWASSRSSRHLVSQALVAIRPPYVISLQHWKYSHQRRFRSSKDMAPLGPGLQQRRTLASLGVAWDLSLYFLASPCRWTQNWSCWDHLVLVENCFYLRRSRSVLLILPFGCVMVSKYLVLCRRKYQDYSRFWCSCKLAHHLQSQSSALKHCEHWDLKSLALIKIALHFHFFFSGFRLILFLARVGGSWLSCSEDQAASAYCWIKLSWVSCPSTTHVTLNMLRGHTSAFI